MKWVCAIGIGIALMALPDVCRGWDKQCDPDDPNSCIQRLAEGQEAPFPGMLLTFRRAAKVVADTEQCYDLRTMDLNEAHELHQIQTNLLKSKQKNDQEAAKLKIDLLRRQLDKVAPPWYEHPAFVAGVSVVLTVAIFAAAVKTVEVLH